MRECVYFSSLFCLFSLLCSSSKYIRFGALWLRICVFPLSLFYSLSVFLFCSICDFIHVCLLCVLCLCMCRIVLGTMHGIHSNDISSHVRACDWRRFYHSQTKSQVNLYYGYHGISIKRNDKICSQQNIHANQSTFILPGRIYIVERAENSSPLLWTVRSTGDHACIWETVRQTHFERTDRIQAGRIASTKYSHRISSNIGNCSMHTNNRKRTNCCSSSAPAETSHFIRCYRNCSVCSMRCSFHGIL